MRNYSFDLMKVLSVFLIILTHVSAPFVIYFKPDSAEFIMGNILDSVSRVGVALFVMITGALWLDETRLFNIKDFFKKYVLKFALLLVAWSVIYGCFFKKIQNRLYGYPVFCYHHCGGDDGSYQSRGHNVGTVPCGCFVLLSLLLLKRKSY